MRQLVEKTREFKTREGSAIVSEMGLPKHLMDLIESLTDYTDEATVSRIDEVEFDSSRTTAGV